MAALTGTDSVFTQQGLFFSGAALVTFGGAYAVLAYVAQKAVEVYGWLAPGEMVQGLALAETTPGPLIMVVQFVAFVGAYRDPGTLNPWVAAVLAALLTTWVTFVPCFMFVFLGAPYVERLRDNHALSSALAGITAAVVGVIANLAAVFRDAHPVHRHDSEELGTRDSRTAGSHVAPTRLPCHHACRGRPARFGSDGRCFVPSACARHSAWSPRSPVHPRAEASRHTAVLRPRRVGRTHDGTHSRSVVEVGHAGRVSVPLDARKTMRLSTRNQLRGTVNSVQLGEAMAVVKVTLDTGQPITASITREAVDDLGLAEGSPVTVLVKSTEVMLAVE